MWALLKATLSNFVAAERGLEILTPRNEERLSLVLLLLPDSQGDRPSRASALLPITFLVPPCRP